MRAVVDGSRIAPERPLLFSYGLPALVRLRLEGTDGELYADAAEASSFSLSIAAGQLGTLLSREYDASDYDNGELQLAFSIASDEALELLREHRLLPCTMTLALNKDDVSTLLSADCVVAMAVQQPEVVDTPIEEAIEAVVSESEPEPEPPQEIEPEPEPETETTVVPVATPPTPVDIQRVAAILQGYYDDSARDYALRAEEAARNALAQAGASETAANNAATVAAVRLEQLMAEYANTAVNAAATATVAASTAADSAVTAIAAVSGAQAGAASAMSYAGSASAYAELSRQYAEQAAQA